VSAALLLESATLLPPDGAAWFRVTVHVLAAPEVTLVGLQAREDTTVTRVVVVIVPLDPMVWIAVPAAEVLRALVMLMVVEDVEADSVTVRTATTPFWIVFAFSPLDVSPVRKHM